MTIEYDGTDFHGWQIQPNAPTIQAAVEHALTTALRQQVSIVGSGRTDAGVHAQAQVAHFDAPAELNPERIRASANGLLPKPIAVLDISPCAPRFHARYDAIKRTYQYRVSIAPRALDRHMRLVVPERTDFDIMNVSAATLVGKHDFSSFCRTQSETDNRVCTVQSAAWMSEARFGDWTFEVSADRFLHGMVRAIVGTLLEVGRGKRPTEDVARILSTRDRRQAGPAASAHGLVLKDVQYIDDEQYKRNADSPT